MTADKQSACCNVEDLKTSMHHTLPAISHAPAWLEARPVLQTQSFPCINGDDGFPGRYQGHSTLEALNGQHLKRLKDQIPNILFQNLLNTPERGETTFDLDAFPCLSS